MLTKQEKEHLLKFCNVKIKQNPLTKKYYWAQYIANTTWYYSNGIEYQTRTQAKNAFIKLAISPA